MATTAETTNKKYTKDSLIGDVIDASPAARKVIEKYFGNGCFTCPGVKMESLSFGAMMHNLDTEKIVKELNELGE
jgi:hybrid cluster-associated redox disulfide protein